MLRVLLLLVVLAGPAVAQADGASDPTLVPTEARLLADLDPALRLATTAILVQARTGAFPADAFALLGSDEAGPTGARALALSSLTMEAPPAGVGGRTPVGAFRVVPLPTAPYVRDDTPMHVVVLQRGDGTYEVQTRIRRERDPDLGGGALLYDQVGRYAVQSGVGVVCVDLARVRAMIAADAFSPAPTALSSEPFTVRVVPPGEDAPVYYRTTTAAR